MTSPFYGARLKVERAEHHINNLYLEAFRFMEKNPYIVYAHPDLEGRGDVIKLEGVDALPDPLVLVLGDALHNLRSALDHALIATAINPTPRTMFPVRNTVQELKAAISGGLKEHAPAEIIDFIVNVIQPYKGGNGEAIWGLHGLDIDDKHKLLIAHLEYTHITGLRAIDDKGENFAIPDWLIVHPHIAPYLCDGHHNIQITDHGKVMRHVKFGDGMALEGELILPTLRNMSKIVSGAIDGLETVFLALAK